MRHKSTPEERKEFRHRLRMKVLLYLNAGLSAFTLILGVLVLLAAETTGNVAYAAAAVSFAAIIAMIQEALLILMRLNKRTTIISATCIGLYLLIIISPYSIMPALSVPDKAIFTVVLTSIYIFIRLGKLIFLLAQAKNKGWTLNIFLLAAFLIGSVVYLSIYHANYLNILYYIGIFMIIEGVIIFFFSIISGSSTVRFIRILIRTHVAEGIFGLLFFMVIASIILEMVEPDEIKSFGDAMWFCFETITTIGFGEFKIVSFAGRIITVLLGIYGIIIVALITSLIVNLFGDSFEREKKNSDEPIAIGSPLDEDKKKKDKKK